MQQGHADQALILIIDQGGHASRAQIIDQDGHIHGQGQVAISARPGSDNSASAHIEYTPETMLASLQEAIKRATASIDSTLIRAAAMATQRSNIICWDKNTGQALSPIISWQDRRAHQWLMTKQTQASFVHTRTGLFMSPHYGASKLHWCLNNIDAVRQASRDNTLAWGPMSSWLTTQLCLEQPFVCDAVNASRTLLWSLQQCNWSAELVQLFELPATGLPLSVANQFDFGHLRMDKQSIPLRLITGDQAAALYATGRPQTDNAYITVGTGAFVLNPCGQQPVMDKQLLSSIVMLDKTGPHYVLEGTVNGAGSALDHYAREFNQPDYISQLPMWLTQSANPPLFLNGFSGLGTPFMQANFTSRFIGDSDEINRLVAVIESIVFLLHCNLERMKLLNPTLQRVIIGGGLAQFDGFCQRLADLGLPVIRPAHTETTSRGLAYLLLQDLELRPNETVDQEYRAVLQTGHTFTPQENPALTQRFQHWRQAMDRQIQHA